MLQNWWNSTLLSENFLSNQAPIKQLMMQNVGSFLPQNRVNMDQVPLPVVVNRKATYNKTKPKKFRK